MRIDIISAVPGLTRGFFDYSIIKRVIDKQLVKVYFHNLHDYANNAYRQVDDYQFGGGAGMVMMIEPIDRCISALKAERTYDEVIFLIPDGDTLQQKTTNKLSLSENLIVPCGHFKGADQRVHDHFVTKEISIGDYVLSEGELGAAVLCDAVIRLIPRVLSDGTSALTNSFRDNLLALPIYTCPANYKGWEVPEVLTSGNTPKIEQWRKEMAYQRTKERRSDLLR